MLALDFVKAHRETVERAIREKNVDLDLGRLLALVSEVRAAKTEIDRLRAERNAVSARFKDATADEKAELGTLLGPAVPYGQVADVVEDVVAAYIELRDRPNELFLETVKRVGVEPFKERVYATH